MKELDEIIKAYYKASNLSFWFKKKYGIEIQGDGLLFVINTKDELYKLSELLNAEVNVNDYSMMCIYDIEYDHKIRFSFIEQKPMTEEQRKEIMDKFVKIVEEQIK